MTTLRAVSLVVPLAVSLAIPAQATVNINIEYVQKSVVFLYGADAAGNVDSTKPLGTGFIVQVPVASDPSKAYKLLVTARHMVDPEWAGCDAQPQKMFLRLNKKDFDPSKGEVGTVDLDLSGEVNLAKQWFFSSDVEVDAAVAVLKGKLLDPYDVGGVYISDFPTPDEVKNFKAGDDVVSAGLLPGKSGKKRNYPFFKFGNLSSIPDESADPPSCGAASPSHSLKLWFVAANLVPGNSGSPIYFSPRPFSDVRAMFLGVQSISFLGWDIAGMTPAQYVYDIISKIPLEKPDLRRNVKPEQPKVGN